MSLNRLCTEALELHHDLFFAPHRRALAAWLEEFLIRCQNFHRQNPSLTSYFSFILTDFYTRPENSCFSRGIFVGEFFELYCDERPYTKEIVKALSHMVMDYRPIARGIAKTNNHVMEAASYLLTSFYIEALHKAGITAPAFKRPIQ